jgi:hypothetical protein
MYATEREKGSESEREREKREGVKSKLLKEA